MPGIYVPGTGNPRAKLMIIGEAPGKNEEIQGEPFVGATGQMLQDDVARAGMAWSETWRSNAYKYRPPDGNIRRYLRSIHVSIETLQEKLWTEIQAIGSNAILTVGDLALEVVTNQKGIKKYRGSILTSMHGGYPKVIPTIHPAALFKGGFGEDEDLKFNYKDKGGVKWFYRHVIKADIKRAVEESQFKEIRLPSRTLQICRSSNDLIAFLSQYENKKFFACDIETVRSMPMCVALAFNKYHAISIPLLDLSHYREGIRIPPNDQIAIWDILDKFFRSGVKAIGQNFKFDEQKLRSFGFYVPPLYADTSLMAWVNDPELPVNLAFLTSFLTKEPFYKDDGREFDIRRDVLRKYLEYNAKDAVVDFECFEGLDASLKKSGLSDFYYNFVNELHKFYIDLEQVGLLPSEDKRIELLKKYLGLDSIYEEEAFNLVGHKFNTRSPKQIGDLLYVELKCPLRKDTQENTLVQLMNNAIKDEKRKRIVELILLSRRVKKVIGTYILAKPDYDGRYRTSVRIGGTETGRSSDNILKPPVRPTKCGLAFKVMSKHGEIGEDFRSMFIADPGYLFMEIDQSQAEARVVALLAEDYDLLEAFDRIDVHRWTASILYSDELMKISMKEVTNEMLEGISPNQRFIGKTARHGGHYDMGKRRLMLEANSNAKRFHIPVRISEWKAGEILRKFHDASPKIRGVFHREVRRLIDKQRKLVGAHGFTRTFYEKDGEELYKEGYAFLPQEAVSLQTKKAGLALKRRKPDLKICVESHDAFTMLVKEDELDYVKKIAKEEFERPISFAKCSIQRGDLVIPCDIKVGSNYKDLKKVSA